MTLNTFADVEHRYHATNQLRSPKGKQYDVRPLGSRRRTWERIARIDDNCYVLTEGYYAADPYPPSPHYSPVRDLFTVDDFLHYAPIVWRRQPDGTETVTISNAGWMASTTHSRHWFLARYLPKGVVLYTPARDGKHYLNINTPLQERRYLPLRNDMTREHVAKYKALNYYVPRRVKIRDTAPTITLQRTGEGVWKILTDKYPEPFRRIDKAAKAEYAADIKEFREWAFAIAPLLPTGSAASESTAPFSRAMSRSDCPHTFARQTLAGDDPVLRLAMLYYIVLKTSAATSWRDAPVCMDTLKSGFTRTLNALCGWNITTEE